jgi:gliding motility-associated-like protein
MKLLSLKHFVIFILIFTNSVSVLAQCPDITIYNQTFCDLESATIADLNAVDNGGGIAWYASIEETTALPLDTYLIDGDKYYVDDSSGLCGSRQEVLVTIYTAPSAPSFQGICVNETSEATIALLLASGNNIQWYLTPSGGLPLPSTTQLINNTLYYVSQINPHTGCETSRRPIFASIIILDTPTGDSDQSFCYNPQQGYPTLADIEISSPLYNWYINQNSVIHLPLSTPLVDGHTYYATSVNGPCESQGRLPVTVHLFESNDAGSSNILNICESDLILSPMLTLFDRLGGTPQQTGSWTGAGIVINDYLGTIDLTLLTPNIPYTFTYTVDFHNDCPLAESTVTLMIIPNLDAGTDDSLELCANDTQTYDLFDLLGNTADLGGIWTPTLASGGSVFDPVLDNFGVYTYSFNDTCNTSSATVTITEIPVFDAGTDGSLELCENDTQTYNLFNLLGGSPDLGGIWTPTLASGGSVFNPVLDAFGVYTYSFNDICSSSATVTITETPILDAGTDGSLELCANDTQTYDLFDLLGGTADLGGIWTPTLASGGSIFDPVLDNFGVYTYSFNDTCNTSSATVTITEFPILDAGTNGNLELCANDTQTYNLFDLLGDSPDLGGNWTPTLASGGSIFNPALDAFGVYTYSFNDICSSSATVTITEIPSLDAGTDGSLELCANDTQTYDLFDLLGGSPDLGGIWTPTLASGGSVFNPALDAFGVYTYSFNDTCNTSSSTVIIISDDCMDDALLIPDGFSPNGDGINDFFEIKDIRILFPNFRIEIYNRYGNILFKGNKDTPDWDGTSQQGLRIDGGKAPVGVYFFILEFNDGKKSPIQGRLYLSR